MRNHLALAVILAGSLVACVDNAATSDNPAQVTTDLAQANGGFTTSDEAPEFGAPGEFEAAALEADAPATDAMSASPEVVALDERRGVDGRDVIVVWGRIPGDPSETTVRDWSGQLQISRGALKVRRTISFDATDHLLPRAAADTVAFQSFTRPFVDGLALRTLDPDPDPTAAAGPATLVYTSAPPAASAVPSVQYTIDLAQLSAGPEVIDAGNGFKLVAIGQKRHDHDGCVGGFLRGRWHAVSAGAGVYLGFVTNRLGEPIGHVRGIYGAKPDGTPVMFGKFIDAKGHFIGLIDGGYDQGKFLAHWMVAGDAEHGRIGGAYFEGSAADDAGHFVGRWAQEGCSEDPDPTGSASGSGSAQ